MAKPGRMKEIEQEWGEPLEILIPRLLNEHSSMPKVAQVLGIGFANFYAWCQENGIEKSVQWTIRKKAEHVA
jgi:hypothetical protein